MDEHPAKIMQYVNTGEVCLGGKETILNSGAIGSCVVITAFDSKNKVGAMAHIMLPGRSPTKNLLQAFKYGANSFEELLDQLKKMNTKPEDMIFCIIGGANVLNRDSEHIGKENLKYINKLLLDKQIEIKAKSIGGFERRTVLFDIEMGCIYYTIGDSKQKTLWEA